MKTREQQLIEWCVRYVHDLCTDDNGTLEVVTELNKVTERELFDGFECISQDMGFDLNETQVIDNEPKQQPIIMTPEESLVYINRHVNPNK